MKREKWDIIAKKLLQEELNDNEEAYFNEAQQDIELNKDITQAEKALQKVELYFDLKKIDTQKAWHKMSSEMEKPSAYISLQVKLLRIAAIFILLTATVFFTNQFIQNRQLLTFETAHYDLSHPKVVLPDGSIVIMSRGSQLSYPKKFKGEIREVILNGEAFFDITPNAKKPFIIKTGTASVKVLGTTFNVNAYQNKETVEVFVETGQVELADATSLNKLLLLPGEKGTFEIKTNSLLKEKPLNTNSLAWISHHIEFKYTNLYEVISTLSNIYNLNIEVDESVDLNQKITASFNQQNIDYIMEVVAITLDLSLTKVDQNTYRIKH